ncbi:MAG TPA: TonB-dependent receptor [Kofleriaceae bacterium]|nr:TonB-dependent receptor [Kofleriaceae bacterium]
MAGGAAPATAGTESGPPRSLRMRSPATSRVSGRSVAQAAPATPQPATADPGTPPAPGVAEPPAAAPGPAVDPAAALSDDEFARLADQQTKEEVIFVTGSTIGRRSLTTPAPLTILDRELLTTGGPASLGDILQQQLASQSNAANAQQNLGGDGTTRINLRGLGISRTLTLINGRRVVPGGRGANVAVDLNTIPLAIVERVEVLKDGASAVYGSDAIGGVVNVITRSDYEGSEATVLTSETQRGDGLAYDASFVTGYNSANKRSNIVFSVGLQDQHPIFAGDRAFSLNDMTYDYVHKMPVMAGSTATPNGRINTKAIDTNGDGIPDPVDLCGAQYCTGSSAGYRAFSTPGDLYNYQPSEYLYTPSSHYHVYSAGTHKIAPAISAFYEASYSDTSAAQQLAPESFVNTVPISKDSMYNPTGGTVLGYQRRLVEFGPRVTSEDLGQFRAVAGFKGSVPDDVDLLKNFKWELSYNYGRGSSEVESTGALVKSRLAAALGPSFMSAAGVPTCGTSTRPIAGCVPMNILGPAGSIDPAAASYVTFTGVGSGYNEQQTVLATAHGRLVTLPNDGDISLAVGGDFRTESGGFTPDPVTAGGDSSLSAIAPTAGSYKVAEGFGELSLVPVTGRPAAEWVELDLAARAFRYSTFGSGVTWKAGGLYRPINGLGLRGSYATAFRAPAISELYQGTSASFLPGFDPCDTRPAGTPVTLAPAVAAECAREGVPANSAFGSSLTLQQARSNPDLHAETAKVLTTGIVIEPPQLKGLSLTADYWRVDIDDAIQRLSMNVVFANCYTRHILSACDQVHRNPLAGGALAYIDLPMANIGGALDSGLDLALAYDHKFTGAGRFRAQIESQYLFKADLDDGSHALHGLGNADLGPSPQIRGNLVTLWQHPSGIGGGVNVRYVGTYKECDQNNCNGGAASRDIGAWYKADLFGSYALRSGAGTTSVTLGVNNVLDRQPPAIYGAALGDYDTTGYDFRGRTFYARMSQQF